jgi:arylsulfatase A-like enzyme
MSFGKNSSPGHSLAALAAALVLSACAPASSPPAHLLLVTIDTLRPDHLGAYGYSRPTSPNLDRFARAAVVFERAYGTSSWTLPSVASLFTAEYPSGHRCRGNRSSLAPGFETLGERLAAAGFATGAVVSHVFFARRYGLDQGFADYDDELVLAQTGDSHRAVSSPAISAKARAWLEARSTAGDGRRWFLWLHYFDPHADYVAHAGVTERFGEAPLDRYDGEIAFTDAHVGEVLSVLAALGFERDTLVIVVSDHGESFGEHGLPGHRITLHEEELRVALLLRAPGVAARRVAAPVSLVDVAPTALELLGLSPLPPAAGVSLVPAMRGAPFERPMPILADLRSALDWRRAFALVAGSWKLMEHRTKGAELYDLASDPGERKNLAAERPQITQRLLWIRRTVSASAVTRGEAVREVPEIPLDPELERRLEALGYVEGPADED